MLFLALAFLSGNEQIGTSVLELVRNVYLIILIPIIVIIKY